MELTDQAISERLQIEPPISEKNPVTPMQAETLLETAGEYFKKAVLALAGASRDERFQDAQVTLMISAMADVGDNLIFTASAARETRQAETGSPPPGETEGQ